MALDYDFDLSKLERVMSGTGKVAALGDELERRGLKRTIVVTGKTLGRSALLERVTGAAVCGALQCSKARGNTCQGAACMNCRR